jgi:hypothetical protein
MAWLIEYIFRMHAKKSPREKCMASTQVAKPNRIQGSTTFSAWEADLIRSLTR